MLPVMSEKNFPQWKAVVGNYSSRMDYFGPRRRMRCIRVLLRFDGPAWQFCYALMKKITFNI